jgi:hypothetical protein
MRVACYGSFEFGLAHSCTHTSDALSIASGSLALGRYTFFVSARQGSDACCAQHTSRRSYRDSAPFVCPARCQNRLGCSGEKRQCSSPPRSVARPGHSFTLAGAYGATRCSSLCPITAMTATTTEVPAQVQRCWKTDYRAAAARPCTPA